MSGRNAIALQTAAFRKPTTRAERPQLGQEPMSKELLTDGRFGPRAPETRLSAPPQKLPFMQGGLCRAAAFLDKWLNGPSQVA